MRTVLDNGTTIELFVEEKGRRDSRAFRITKLVSDVGASVIAYRAYHQNSSNIGILREYYPIKDDLALERDENGRIYLDVTDESEAERKDYMIGRDKYLAPYLELRKLQREKENDDLASFIPYFEICYGCQDADQDDGTVYIWTPAPQTETFAHFCEEVHNNPMKEPEYKLYTILSSILSLTKCVEALHCIRPVGLIHRDIKPENFGFAYRGGELLTQSISLFDVDSICKAYPVPKEDVGTLGFMENDCKGRRRNDNLRDIYSIGATLFYAIIITDETKESSYKYRDSYYDNISEFVKTSKLISASINNSYPKLRSYLTRILKKCLCSRYSQEGRYEDCEALASDLQTAIGYIVPAEISKNYMSGEKWVLQDAKKWCNEHEEKVSKLALHYHLYQYPLYQRVKDKENINVLFVGFGRYGFKFLDLVLQAAQNIGGRLKVLVVSDSMVENDKTDETLYLEERSELKNFFNIHGYESVNDAYGEIEFKSIGITADKAELGIERTAMEEIIAYGHKFDYVFIDLSDNALNSDMAELLYKSDTTALINYIHEGHENSGFLSPDHVVPIRVSDDIRECADFSEIERMAFNVHLVWNENSDIGFDVKKSEFQEEYNYNSCVSNVLAIKYKLWAVGIDLDEVGIYEAAKSMDTLLKDSPDNRRYLAWLEHKRWVTEKICDGWKARTIDRCYELAKIEDDVTRDKKRKEHVCIIKGDADWKLESIDTEQWDAGGLDVSKLDSLDRLSVELHRFYEKQSEKIQIGDFSAERDQLLRTSAISIFEEWIEIKNEINHGGDRDIAALFKAYWLRLKDAINCDSSGEITDSQKNLIIKTIEQRIAPILRRYEYKDYKKIDVDLIDKIPYILTYTEYLNLIYPLGTFDDVAVVDGIDVSSEFVFKQVAAATVLDPAEITYLYYAPERSGLNIFEDPMRLSGVFRRIIAYKKRKDLRFGIKLVILCHSEGTKSIYEMSELDKKEIDIEFICIEKKDNPSKAVDAYVTSMPKEGIFLVEQTDAVEKGWLANSNIRRMLSCYKLDMKEIVFSKADDCEWIRYIKGRYSIGARDLAVLSGRNYSLDEKVDFGKTENAELWKIYKEDSSRWKRCSGFLSKGEHRLTQLLSCNKEKVCVGGIGTFKFYMPAKCYRAMTRCLEAFIKNGLLEAESDVIYCSDTVCCLVARCTSRMRDEIDHMLSIPYAFEDVDEIKITSSTEKGELYIHYSGLEFKGINLKSYVKELADNNQINNSKEGKDEAEREIQSLLIKFNGKGIIHDLSTKGGIVSFAYGSQTIKKLMENAGNMLELEVFQELSGIQSQDVGHAHYFDDVVAGITFQDKNDAATEQIDCLVTKGFKTMIIECKAQDSLSRKKIEEYARKLKNRVDKFGISCKGLLLIDSNESLDTTRINSGVVIKRIDDIGGEDKNKIGHFVAELMTK